MDFKVRGLEFKSSECKIIKKNWGVRSRGVRSGGLGVNRVRESIELGIGGSIGIGSGLVMSTLFLLRNTLAKKKTN